MTTIIQDSCKSRDYANNGSRFWDTDVSPGDAVFGLSTRGIVDEDAGGIICYAHEINAEAIIEALREYTGEI